MVAAAFFFCYLNNPLPYVRHHLTVNKKVLSETKHLMMHSTYLIYSYSSENISLRTIQNTREETCCHKFMDYSFQIAARALLYAQYHRQDIKQDSCRVLVEKIFKFHVTRLFKMKIKFIREMLILTSNLCYPPIHTYPSKSLTDLSECAEVTPKSGMFCCVKSTLFL